MGGKSGSIDILHEKRFPRGSDMSGYTLALARGFLIRCCRQRPEGGADSHVGVAGFTLVQEHDGTVSRPENTGRPFRKLQQVVVQAACLVRKAGYATQPDQLIFHFSAHLHANPIGKATMSL